MFTRNLSGDGGLQPGHVTRYHLDELSERTPLAEIVGRRVALRRTGKNWQGCCPFHADNTASFTVYDDGFHCFGCDAHGDAIDFVRKMEGISFRDAVAHLEGEAGLDPVKRISTPKKKPGTSAYVGRIAKEYVPIAGTIAETYLRKTRALGDLPLPDELRFHPAVWSSETQSKHPALIIPCFENGRIVRLQAVLLDPKTGKKAELASPKLTFGAGYSRVPASFAARDGSVEWILLAEGPEDAATLNAVTGLRADASLGSGSLKKPVYPAGTRLLIVGDNTAEGRIKAEQAAKEHRKRGAYVLTTFPEDAKDSNDLLIKAGPGAVRRRIESVIAARRVSVDEGRKQTKEAIRKFFTAVRNGADPTTAMGVRVDVGLGKSTLARDGVVDLLAEMRAAGNERSLVFAVDTHVLGSEAIDEFQSLPGVVEHGFVAAQWRGRSADDPTSPGNKMCVEPDRVLAAQAAGADVERACCRKELPDGTVVTCPMFSTCAYQRQKRQGHADVWFVAHESVFTPKPAAIGEPAAIIYDETFWQAGLEGVDGGLDLTVESFRLVSSLEGLSGERQRFLRITAMNALLTHHPGPLMRDKFLSTGLTKDTALEAGRLEWRLHTVPDLNPGMTNEQFQEARRAAEHNKTVRRLARFWKALAALLDDNGPERSGWATIEIAHLKEGEVLMLRLKGRKDIRTGWQAPSLLIDAKFDINLTRPYFPNIEQIADIAVHAPHQHIIQIKGRSNSKQRLIDAPHAKDNKRREKHRKDIGGTLRKIARGYKGRGLVVAQQALETWIDEQGELPKRIDLAHFNALAGLDKWGPKPDRRGIEFLVSVGRVQAPTGSVEALREALTGEAVDRLTNGYPQVEVAREMADGSTVTTMARRHPDTVCEAIRYDICEGQLVQTVGRARGVNRTADNPVDIYILDDVPIPLPVNTLVEAHRLDPSPVDRMLDEGGAAFLSGPDAAAVYPGLWTPAAAKSALARAEKQGEKWGAKSSKVHKIGSAPNFLLVEYQRSGQGRSLVQAVFDLSCIPDPQAYLTAVLGPLVAYRVIDDEPTAEAPEPAPRKTAPAWMHPLHKHQIRQWDSIYWDTPNFDQPPWADDVATPPWTM